MADENIKVIVRVRPFNKREKERKAKCIVEMQGDFGFRVSHSESIAVF